MYFCNIPSVLIIMASITDYCVILLGLIRPRESVTETILVSNHSLKKELICFHVEKSILHSSFCTIQNISRHYPGELYVCMFEIRH